MDGNYSGTLEVRLKACDTVIFLAPPPLVCVWRVLKRALMYRKGGRTDMAAGCDEKLDFEFILWVWQYRKRTRPKVLKPIEEISATKTFIRLRMRAETEKFLAALEAEFHDAAAPCRTEL